MEHNKKSVYQPKGKKWLALLLTICMVFSMMPMSSLSVFAAAAGSGTADDPYQITTAEELKNISGSNHYVLMNDIALTEAWTPIDSFSGTLDGKGKTISGLSINSSSSTLGFIKTLSSSGTVKNLTISGTVVSTYNSNAGRVGGVVGVNEGMIDNCEFHGSVSQKQGDNMCVAGIAGYNEGTISGCKNYGDITGISTGGSYDAVYVGGITGSNHGTVEISNCTNYGTIFGSVPNTNTYIGEIWGSEKWERNGAYVGGIAGDTNKSNAPGCTNNGTVMGENSNVDTNLISITAPEAIALDAPITLEELQAQLPKTLKLETTQGARVGSVTWDTTKYNADKNNTFYDFIGTVTLPDTVKNPDNVFLNVTIHVTVGEPAPEEHIHCVCGGKTNVGDHTAHQDVSYQPLDSSFTDGTLAAGSYYLTEDITLTEDIVINENVNLCLNGHVIYAGDNSVMISDESAVFNITDCTGSGSVRGTGSYLIYNTKGTTNIFSIAVETTGTYGTTILAGKMNMYGGSIKAASGGMVAQGGVLNIYGGEITAPSDGVYASSDAVVNITGGTIQATDSSLASADVDLHQGATLYLGGTPNISKIWYDESDQTSARISAKCGGQDYTGGTIQLQSFALNANDIGNIIVSDVTQGTNDDKFSLDSEAYYLKLDGTNLIVAPVTHSVTLNSGTGYTLEAAPGSTSPVNYNKSFTFNFALAEGYSKTADFAVKVNGTPVNLNNAGSYTISYITEDTTVTVEGVADITAPTGKISIGTNEWNKFLNTITFGLFFKETQSVEITAEDAGSGVDKISYYLADDAKTEEELKAFDDWVEYADSFSIVPNNKYVIYAKLVDKDGNTAYINTEGLVLDDVAPALTQNETAVASNAQYYGDTEFTVSDLYLATVTVDGNAITPDVNGKFTIIADNKDHAIVVTDHAGNSISRTVTVHQCFTITYKTNEGFELGTITYGVTEANLFPQANQLSTLFPEAIAKLKETGSLYVKNPLWYSDKDFTTQAVMPNAPTAGQNYVFYCAFTTSTTITSTQTADHTYGGDLISGYNFGANYGVEWFSSRNTSDFEFVYEKKVGDQWQVVDDSFKTDLNGDIWDNRIFPKTVADSGIYRIAYIKASVKDNDGNLLFSEYIYPSEADQEGKQVNVLPRTLTISGVTASDREYDGTTTVLLSGGVLQGVLPNDDVSFILGTGTMVDAIVGSAKAVTTNITLCGEYAGNYILVQPTDVSVNITDTTAPTGEIAIDTNKWHEFLNNITFGLFFKDTQSVTITAEDLGSGVQRIAYYIAEAEMTLDEVKAISDWQEYTGSFNIEPNHEYVIYVKLIDNSGNVSYINSDGVVLDNILPAISGIENGKTYCGAVEVTVDEAYVDTVTINGETVTLADEKFTVAPADGEQTIVVTDKAGNSTEMTITVNDGHTWGEYTSNGDATCTADGTKTAKCQFCDAADTVADEGSMLAHTFGEWTDAKDGEHHIRTCSCGAAETEAHKWDNGKVTKEATTTEKGEKTYTCAVCGATKTEEIPMLADAPQTGDTSSTMPWVVLMFLSGVGLTFETVFRKKKTAKK